MQIQHHKFYKFPPLFYLIDDDNRTHREEAEAELDELKKAFRERCDGYSARFFALIAPSILFPLANGVSDAMGYSLVDSPNRQLGYAGSVLLHTFRRRPDAINLNSGYQTIGQIITSTSLFDGVLLSGLSYGFGYGLGAIIDKVYDLSS